MTAPEVRPTRTGTAPWPAEVARRYRAAGLWTGEPLGTRFATAARLSPHAVALVDGDVRLSCAELAARVDGAARRLRDDLGLAADDRVVVALPNCWEFVVLTLACFRAGLVPVMALPVHRAHELGHLTAASDARAIAVPGGRDGSSHAALADELVAAHPLLEHVLVTGPGAAGADRAARTDLTELCAPDPDPAAARAELDAAAPAADAVALFLLSGGTTGLPKLIARTHDDYGYGATRSGEVCGFSAGTRYLAVLPMSHNYTLAGPGVLGTLLAGGRVVVGRSPAPERMFPLVAAEGVTVTSLVPAVVARWIDHCASGDADPADLRSLELLQVGGARIPDHVAEQVGPVLGAELQQGYGMAEGLICFTRPGDGHGVTCRTQGRPISPHDELLVVDERGAPVAPGEPGALLTRGPYTHRGYYRADGHNASAFTADGWFRTGDVVRVRPDGNLVVEGRDKDMINRGGEKVSAEAVENFALQVPGVARAAAVAMPDPVLGERVCLYVVPRPGHEVGLADVLGVMDRAGVARFVRPERLVRVVDLPVTGIGKTDKKALRADIAGRLAAESRATA